MNHLKEARENVEIASQHDSDITQELRNNALIAIAHALIAIAEQLQAGNSKLSADADWFTINDDFVRCRFCGVWQSPHLQADGERHADYCQRGQWVTENAPANEIANKEAPPIDNYKCEDCAGAFYMLKNNRCFSCNWVKFGERGV